MQTLEGACNWPPFSARTILQRIIATSSTKWRCMKVSPSTGGQDLYNSSCDRSSKKKLGYQQQFSCGLACFQIAVCLLRLFQLINVLNTQLKPAFDDHLEHIRCAPLEFLARSGVVKQRGTCKKERSLLGKFDGIECRYRSARAAKEHNISARPHDVQVFVKSAFADPVIDHVDAFAVG